MFSGRPSVTTLLGVVALLSIIVLSGCVSVPLNSQYKGPKIRPAEIEQYYSKGNSFTGYKESDLQEGEEYNFRLVTINTKFGDIKIDYYDSPAKDKDLILVFPLLGGKPIVESHFAKYYAEHGFDTAIVRRNEDFKNPDNFDNIEEMLRLNVVRDRIALDFFEKIYYKHNFGAFGISRGAINVSMTAGIDPRLKYVVIAMGASDLPLIFKHSDEKRLKKYVEQVMKDKDITKAQFFTFLEEQVKTDPKYLAQYIDARNTMMFLCLFDETVPYEYGRRLRATIGEPKTVFLLSNHYTAVAFTQLFSILPPGKDNGLFPFNYIELESLDFFRRKFERKKPVFGLWPFKIMRLPFDLIGNIAERVF